MTTVIASSQEVKQPFIILADTDDKTRKSLKCPYVSGGVDRDDLKIPRDPTPWQNLSRLMPPPGLAAVEKRRRGKSCGLAVGRGLRRDGSVASDRT